MHPRPSTSLCQGAVHSGHWRFKGSRPGCGPAPGGHEEAEGKRLTVQLRHAVAHQRYKRSFRASIRAEGARSEVHASRTESLILIGRSAPQGLVAIVCFRAPTCLD